MSENILTDVYNWLHSSGKGEWRHLYGKDAAPFRVLYTDSGYLAIIIEIREDGEEFTHAATGIRATIYTPEGFRLLRKSFFVEKRQ